MATPDPDSIAGIAARLALWGSRAPKGLARVEFSSDFSRQQVDARVSIACSEANIPFTSIELPQNKPAPEIVAFLLDKMAPLPHGVVSITGWATAFPRDVDLLDSLRVLNYNRENLAQFPLCQIWWLTRHYTDAVIREIPDLASWFIVRLNLRENIAAPHEEFISNGQAASSLEQQAAARHRSANLSNRFHNAIAQGASLPDTSALATAAVEELVNVGLDREANELSIQLVNTLLSSAEYQSFLADPSVLSQREQARLFQSLGHLYKQQRGIAKAEDALENALKLAEEISGPVSDDVAQILNNLASLYDSEARCAEAERLYTRALAIREDSLGREHPDIATDLSNLARLYVAQDRIDEAEPLYERSLAIMTKALGPEHPATARSLSSLAGLYMRLNRYAEAESLYGRSLAIMEKTFGPEHPCTAFSLGLLAMVLNYQGRYVEAESLYERSLAISEKALGLGHPDTASSLDDLAGLYTKQGRYAEAEPLYGRSLAIKEMALGLEHPGNATGLRGLARLYVAQGRIDEAEPLYARSLAISEKALGPEHPYTAFGLNDLAGLYSDQGRYAEAELLSERSVAILEKASPKIYMDVLIATKDWLERIKQYRSLQAHADSLAADLDKKHNAL